MSLVDKSAIYLKIFEASVQSLKDVSQQEALTPQQTDLYRTQLVALYALLSEELGLLESEKATAWLYLKKHDEDDRVREKPISGQETEMLYDASPNGKRRIIFKYQLKAMEKMISALSARQRRLEAEARNEGYGV